MTKEEIDRLYVTKWNWHKDSHWLGNVNECRRIGLSRFSTSRGKDALAATLHGKPLAHALDWMFVGLARNQNDLGLLIEKLRCRREFDPLERYPRLASDPMIDKSFLESALKDFKNRIPEDGNYEQIEATLEGVFLGALCERLRERIDDPGLFLVKLLFPDFLKRCQDIFSQSGEATLLGASISSKGMPSIQFKHADGRILGAEISSSSQYALSPETMLIPEDLELDGLHVITWNWRTDIFALETAIEARARAFEQYSNFKKRNANVDPISTGDFGYMSRTLMDVTASREEAERLLFSIKAKRKDWNG